MNLSVGKEGQHWFARLPIRRLQPSGGRSSQVKQPSGEGAVKQPFSPKTVFSEASVLLASVFIFFATCVSIFFATGVFLLGMHFCVLQLPSSERRI